MPEAHEAGGGMEQRYGWKDSTALGPATTSSLAASTFGHENNGTRYSSAYKGRLYETVSVLRKELDSDL